MTIKEIRAEVERLKNELIKEPNKSEIDEGRISAFEDILLYIDSEEPISEDLEEEIDRCSIVNYRDLAYHFYQLGMKDAKQQMMKDAVEVYVCTNLDKTRKIPCSTEWGGRIPWNAIFENCNVGDKVKLIIIKED